MDSECVREVETLDPYETTDTVSLALLFISAVFNGLGILYIMYQRNFRPIAAKQPYILLIQYIAGVFWTFSSTLVSDSHGLAVFYDAQQYWWYCTLRRFVLQFFFGLSLWFVCMIYRMIRLYVIIIMMKVPWPTHIIFAILMVPWGILVIFGFGLQADQSCVYVIDQVEVAIRCSIKFEMITVLVLFVLMYFVCAVVLGFLLRNIRKSFNEYKEVRLQLSIGMIIVIIASILALLRLNVGALIRFIEILLFITAVTSIQWIAIAVPIYRTLRNKEEYLKDFNLMLSKDANDAVSSSIDSKPKMEPNHLTIN